MISHYNKTDEATDTESIKNKLQNKHKYDDIIFNLDLCLLMIPVWLMSSVYYVTRL
jgi:hypothetical protein